MAHFIQSQVPVDAVLARDSATAVCSLLAVIPLVTTDSRIDLIEHAISLAADVVSALNNMRRFEVSQFEF